MPTPRQTNAIYQQDQEAAATAAAANVKTSVRTRREVPEAIRRRAPRSGLQVTRPTEDRFLTGADVTGVNELENK